MKKVRLEVEALTVESFSVTSEAGGVAANELSALTGCACPAPPPTEGNTEPTCQDSCQRSYCNTIPCGCW